MKCEKTPLKGTQCEIKKLLEEGVMAGIFPAAAAGISYGCGSEKKEVVSFYGNATLYPKKRTIQKNNFFDLASLTKPLATSMAVLCLIKEKKIDIEEPLTSLLERKIPGEKKRITTKNLLSHSSGLPAHREYYHILNGIALKDKDKYIEDIILREKMEYNPGTTTLYSDLGFILLGRIIEKKAGCTLADYVTEKVLKPLNLMEKIFYNPLNHESKRFKKNDFVATERCPWRKKILCGEVHDDNCYAMGGVAGHSGLFGNVEGVTALTGKILEMWQGRVEHPNIKREDLEYFLTRQQIIEGSTWALGFDTPNEKESSSGKYLSPKSVGHLGFTGTSFWIDLEKKTAIVLLTNRVHPSRENNKIKKFRPYFHDRVMEKLFS